MITEVYSIPHFGKTCLSKDESRKLIPIISTFLRNDSLRYDVLNLLHTIALVDPSYLISLEIIQANPKQNQAIEFHVYTPFLLTTTYPTNKGESYQKKREEKQQFIIDDKKISIINEFEDLEIDPNVWTPDEIKLGARILQTLMSERKDICNYIAMTDMFRWYCEKSLDIPFKAKIAAATLFAHAINYFKEKSLALFANLEQIMISIGDGICMGHTSIHSMHAIFDSLLFLRKYIEIDPEIMEKIDEAFGKDFEEEDYDDDDDDFEEETQREEDDKYKDLSDTPDTMDDVFSIGILIRKAKMLLNNEE